MVPVIRAHFAWLVIFAAILSGCLSDAGGKTGILDPVKQVPRKLGLPDGIPDPLVLNHDHADAKLHEFAYGVKEVYHHPLGGNVLKSSGAHAVDVQNGFLFVAAYGATVDIGGGVYIFDLKEPERPRLVGQVNLAGSLGGDRSMEATDDGNFVALGTEAIDCAGHTNPFGPGLYLIDARDKTRPTVADYVPAPGVHSLSIHRIKGEDYVFALMGGRNILKIDKSGPRPALVGVGQVQIGHDSALYDDPVLGLPILYSATASRNLLVHDVSDPAQPRSIGKWALDEQEGKNHYVHAVAVDWIEGRRIVALESEDWRSLPSPVWILDATDLGDIERIGNWTNPGQKPANAGQAGGSFGGQLTFSTHNPRLERGLLYLSHYHGGVWVLNVSSLAQAREPEILGYYLPHNNNGGFTPRSAEGTYPKPNFCGFELDEIPIVFDLEVQNGVIYAADLHTGLYVLKASGGAAGPPH